MASTQYIPIVYLLVLHIQQENKKVRWSEGKALASARLENTELKCSDESALFADDESFIVAASRVRGWSEGWRGGGVERRSSRT